jgi:ribosomal protein S18 acetylase RimI-like enzyme
LIQKEDFETFQQKYPNRAVTTDEYDYDDLAMIYSDARTDYIVPMPMNGKRMKQYVLAYDIDLSTSIVAVDPDDDEVNGICMLGVREDRTWITRLGVIPHRRRRKSGEFLMRAEIEETLKLNRKIIQLEVIKGNEPAHYLFKKLGFEESRELLVIRRPPGPVDKSKLPEMEVEPMLDTEINKHLNIREEGAAWTEESASLLNTGGLHGLHITLPENNEMGWVIFQLSAFQLSHFVLSPNVSQQMTDALIAAVHQYFPMQDTKIENVPVDHYSWASYEKYGYVVSFRRIEMLLHL